MKTNFAKRTIKFVLIVLLISIIGRALIHFTPIEHPTDDFMDSIPVVVERLDVFSGFSNGIDGRFYMIFKDSYDRSYYGKTEYSIDHMPDENIMEIYDKMIFLGFYNHHGDTIATWYIGKN